MLGNADLVAFVASRDLEAAGRFYGAILRLPMLETNEFARVYDASGTQLRVTRVESLAEAPYSVLGWRVTDIAQTTAELRRAGVQFKSYAGMKDGNILSVQQDPDS